jgi:hypothetical protein
LRDRDVSSAPRNVAQGVPWARFQADSITARWSGRTPSSVRVAASRHLGGIATQGWLTASLAPAGAEGLTGTGRAQPELRAAIYFTGREPQQKRVRRARISFRFVVAASPAYFSPRTPEPRLDTSERETLFRSSRVGANNSSANGFAKRGWVLRSPGRSLTSSWAATLLGVSRTQRGSQIRAFFCASPHRQGPVIHRAKS